MALRSFDPVALVFIRILSGAIVLAPFAFRRSVLRQLRVQPLAVLAVALLQGALPLWLLTMGQLAVPSGVAGILMAAQPVITVAIAGVVRREHRPRALAWCGIALGVLGVTLASDLRWEGGEVTTVGFLLVMAAVVCYAVAPVLIGTRLESAPPVGVVGIGLAANSLVLAPVTLLRGTDAVDASLPAIGSAVFLGVVCTALAFVAFHSLIVAAGPLIAGTTVYGSTLVAILIGVLLAEPITAATVAGATLIAAACWLTTRSARIRAPKELAR